jgi:hypothetical protein
LDVSPVWRGDYASPRTSSSASIALEELMKKTCMGLIPVEADGRFFLTVHPEKARRVCGLRKIEPAAEMFPPDAHGRFRLPTGI